MQKYSRCLTSLALPAIQNVTFCNLLNFSRPQYTIQNVSVKVNYLLLHKMTVIYFCLGTENLQIK